MTSKIFVKILINGKGYGVPITEIYIAAISIKYEMPYNESKYLGESNILLPFNEILFLVILLTQFRFFLKTF